MFEMVLQVVLAAAAATLVIAFGLPLLGFVTGLIVRVAVPYVLVPGIAFSLLRSVHPMAPQELVLGVLMLLWMVLVLGTRQALARSHALQLSWFQGHYRAAASLLSLGGLATFAVRIAEHLNRDVAREELDLAEG